MCLNIKGVCLYQNDFPGWIDNKHMDCKTAHIMVKNRFWKGEFGKTRWDNYRQLRLGVGQSSFQMKESFRFGVFTVEDIQHMPLAVSQMDLGMLQSRADVSCADHNDVKAKRWTLLDNILTDTPRADFKGPTPGSGRCCKVTEVPSEMTHKWHDMGYFPHLQDLEEEGGSSELNRSVVSSTYGTAALALPNAHDDGYPKSLTMADARSVAHAHRRKVKPEGKRHKHISKHSGGNGNMRDLEENMQGGAAWRDGHALPPRLPRHVENRVSGDDTWDEDDPKHVPLKEVRVADAHGQAHGDGEDLRYPPKDVRLAVAKDGGGGYGGDLRYPPKDVRVSNTDGKHNGDYGNALRYPPKDVRLAVAKDGGDNYGEDLRYPPKDVPVAVSDDGGGNYGKDLRYPPKDVPVAVSDDDGDNYGKDLRYPPKDVRLAVAKDGGGDYGEDLRYPPKDVPVAVSDDGDGDYGEDLRYPPKDVRVSNTDGEHNSDYGEDLRYQSKNVRLAVAKDVGGDYGEDTATALDQGETKREQDEPLVGERWVPPQARGWLGKPSGTAPSPTTTRHSKTVASKWQMALGHLRKAAIAMASPHAQEELEELSRIEALRSAERAEQGLVDDEGGHEDGTKNEESDGDEVQASTDEDDDEVNRPAPVATSTVDDDTNEEDEEDEDGNPWDDGDEGSLARLEA